MSFPIYKLSEVRQKNGTKFDELVAVLGNQHITRTKMQVGQVLTAIEAALGDTLQAGAMKSLVKEAIWNSAVKFEESDLVSAVAHIARECGDSLTLYQDKESMGRYLYL